MFNDLYWDLKKRLREIVENENNPLHALWEIEHLLEETDARETELIDQTVQSMFATKEN